MLTLQNQIEIRKPLVCFLAFAWLIAFKTNIISAQSSSLPSNLHVLVSLHSDNSFTSDASVWVDGEPATFDPRTKYYVGHSPKELYEAFEVRVQLEGYETFRQTIAVSAPRQITHVTLGKNPDGYFQSTPFLWRPKDLINRKLICVGGKFGLLADSSLFGKDQEFQALKERLGLREIPFTFKSTDWSGNLAQFPGYIQLARKNGTDFEADNVPELSAFREAGYFAGVSTEWHGIILNSFQVVIAHQLTLEEVERIGEALGLEVSPTGYQEIYMMKGDAGLGYGINSLLDSLMLHPEFRNIQIESLSMPEL
ncbi:MAG: hypothetical protein KA239_02880 [Bacteroidia bacterium]|nr:hypothetical protein [Bacteroidia bacterium]